MRDMKDSHFKSGSNYMHNNTCINNALGMSFESDQSRCYIFNWVLLQYNTTAIIKI